MSILVIAEHDNATLKLATLPAITAAKQIGGEIHVLVAGANAAAVAQAASQVANVDKVLHMDVAASRATDCGKHSRLSARRYRKRRL